MLFTTGCVPDPSRTGSAPSGRGCEWNPKTQGTCYWYRKVSSKIRTQYAVPDPTTPLSIFEMIDYALWNNPDTKKSWADARAAAYNVGMEKSALYPTVSVQETLAFIKESSGGGVNSSIISNVTDVSGTAGAGIAGGTNGIGGFGNNPQYFQVLVTDLLLSYLILDFGGREGNIEAARQALYASDWLHNRTLQTVIINVIDAYYQEINDAALYLASLRTLEDAKMALDSAQTMLSVGIKTIADVLQAKATYAGSQLNVVDTAGNLKISQGKLARTLGLPADTHLEVQVIPENLEVQKVSTSIEELMCIAKQNRPDLAAVHAQLLQKQAELRVAQSAALPTLTGNVDIEDDHFINNTRLDGYTYTGAVVLDVPIFSGFFYVNQIKQAREEVRSAYASLQNKMYDILLEVLESYYKYQTALENLGYSKDYLDASRMNYDVALANYKNGVGTILEVLNALKDLAQARSQFIESRTEWLTSIAGIAYTTGTIGNNPDFLPIKRDKGLNQ